MTRRNVRLDPDGLDRITERARRADVDVSHMIRRMLTFADRYMPADWLPSGNAEPGPGDANGTAMLAGPPPGQFGPPPGEFGPPPGEFGPPPGARQGKARRAS